MPLKGEVMLKQSGKIHYAWIIVIAGFLTTGASVGLLNNCVSVFIKPVSEDLGFLRSEFTLYQTISTLTSVLLLPLFSEVYARLNLKKVIFIGSIIGSAALYSYSFARQLWQFYIIAFIYGISINCIAMTIVGLIINKWFKDKKGVASGIAFAGSGCFAAIAVPILTQIIDNYGWQYGYMAIGVSAIVILLPTTLFLIKINPSDMGLKPYVSPKKNEEKVTMFKDTLTGIRLSDAKKTPCFWTFILWSFLMGFVSMGMQPHTMAYLTDIGYDNTFSSLMVSVIMIGMTAGKLILGYIFDEVGAFRGALIGTSAGLFAAILVLFAGNSTIFAVGYSLFIGISCSTGTVAVNYLSASYFGDLDFARILPMVSMACLFGVSLGSPFSGLMFDLMGSYTIAWLIYLVLAIVALGVIYYTDKSTKKLEFEIVEVK